MRKPAIPRPAFFRFYHSTRSSNSASVHGCPAIFAATAGETKVTLYIDPFAKSAYGIIAPYDLQLLPKRCLFRLPSRRGS
jgi:hypothetical protein